MLKLWIHCVKGTHVCAANRLLAQNSNKFSTKAPPLKKKRKSKSATRPMAGGLVELDKLRTDVENSFGVEYEDDQVLVHGVGIGKSGKTLVHPLLNPTKKDGEESNNSMVADETTKEQGNIGYNFFLGTVYFLHAAITIRINMHVCAPVIWYAVASKV